ncbi:hypothetical protein H8B02_29160 [Bradyrhizobium sp. Pear77]|uniref:hypothetical protein n=1 Tax=Bradyrhizobium altum TaxID=1571202 RepID=UPI001E39EC01|nr:hypothetical protein [Bradyrhizobium altum]MCC8957359.1 hypothetical protein [Bradyrhizobium altum]
MANNDRLVQPYRQRSIEKHRGRAVFETDGRYVPVLLQADLVLDLIRKAADAVRLQSKTVLRACFREPAGSAGDATGDALSETSAEFVHTYAAIVNAVTAAVINAEAGLNWLSAQPPDLEAVRRTLDAIVKDGKRAGEIVVQLRAPLKTSLRLDDLPDS